MAIGVTPENTWTLQTINPTCKCMHPDMDFGAWGRHVCYSMVTVSTVTGVAVQLNVLDPFEVATANMGPAEAAEIGRRMILAAERLGWSSATSSLSESTADPSRPPGSPQRT